MRRTGSAASTPQSPLRRGGVVLHWAGRVTLLPKLGEEEDGAALPPPEAKSRTQHATSKLWLLQFQSVAGRLLHCLPCPPVVQQSLSLTAIVPLLALTGSLEFFLDFPSAVICFGSQGMYISSVTRTGMTRHEILHALETLDRLDQEHSDKFGRRSGYGGGSYGNSTNNTQHSGMSPSPSNSYDTSPQPCTTNQNGRESNERLSAFNGKMSPTRYPLANSLAQRSYSFEASEEDLDIDDKGSVKCMEVRSASAGMGASEDCSDRDCRVVKCWHRLSREVVDVPSQETFKVRQLFLPVLQVSPPQNLSPALWRQPLALCVCPTV
ncbi:hypothetical protein DV515_00013047 [Chloebia gouldiae]|uniref:Hepatocyte nuclear factor 1 N-terminal domain-containing protein n=1 Tax=Chloebia gouldiae TaxID=44316 RepID=A0A3L8S2D6_CHLGU|nr:hypothetical protein DV515_00013047 [Chloebia gouldiae]